MIERGLDDRLAARFGRDRIGIGDGLSTGRLNFVDDFLRGTDVFADTVERTTEIIDDDLRALRRQQQRIGAPEATRSEERRVGKERVSTGRYRWWRYTSKKKTKQI